MFKGLVKEAGSQEYGNPYGYVTAEIEARPGHTVAGIIVRIGVVTSMLAPITACVRDGEVPQATPIVKEIEKTPTSPPIDTSTPEPEKTVTPESSPTPIATEVPDYTKFEAGGGATELNEAEKEQAKILGQFAGYEAYRGLVGGTEFTKNADGNYVYVDFNGKPAVVTRDSLNTVDGYWNGDSFWTTNWVNQENPTGLQMVPTEGDFVFLKVVDPGSPNNGAIIVPAYGEGGYWKPGNTLSFAPGVDEALVLVPPEGTFVSVQNNEYVAVKGDEIISVLKGVDENGVPIWEEVVSIPDGVSQVMWDMANEAASTSGLEFVQAVDRNGGMVIIGGNKNGERTHRWNGLEWVELGLIDSIRIEWNSDNVAEASPIHGVASIEITQNAYNRQGNPIHGFRENLDEIGRKNPGFLRLANAVRYGVSILNGKVRPCLQFDDEGNIIKTYSPMEMANSASGPVSFDNSVPVRYIIENEANPDFPGLPFSNDGYSTGWGVDPRTGGLVIVIGSGLFQDPVWIQHLFPIALYQAYVGHYSSENDYTDPVYVHLFNDLWNEKTDEELRSASNPYDYSPLEAIKKISNR